MENHVEPDAFAYGHLKKYFFETRGEIQREVDMQRKVEKCRDNYKNIEYSNKLHKYHNICHLCYTQEIKIK